MALVPPRLQLHWHFLGVLEWSVCEVDHSCIYLCGVLQLYLCFGNEMHLQFSHILLLALTKQHTLMTEMLLDAHKIYLLCSMLCTWKMDV